MAHDETVTQTLTGNGLLIERTEKPDGVVPWWWINPPDGTGDIVPAASQTGNGLLVPNDTHF